ncbi:hypothetical protein V6Z90_000457 [Aspergillus fumigatus]
MIKHLQSADEGKVALSMHAGSRTDIDTLSLSEDIDTPSRPTLSLRQRRHEDPAAGGPSLISDPFHMRQTKPHRFSRRLTEQFAYIPRYSSFSTLSFLPLPSQPSS